MNKNVADYTNFGGGGKTNNRVIQAPGGTSSISLGWDGNDHKHVDVNLRGFQKNQYNQSTQQYSQKGIQRSNGNNIGGEYGYNNYEQKQYTGQNNNQNNNYNQMQYQNNIQKDYQNKGQSSWQKDEPVSIYKPSTSSRNQRKDELDMALEEHKYQVESSRAQRNQISQQSNSSNNGDSRTCVKIRPVQQTNVFGGDYDYWKQDGHNYQNKVVKKTEAPYHHQKNINNGGNKNYNNNAQSYEGNNYVPEKTSVRVHNPPGGKSNFTFG